VKIVVEDFLTSWDNDVTLFHRGFLLMLLRIRPEWHPIGPRTTRALAWSWT